MFNGFTINVIFGDSIRLAVHGLLLLVDLVLLGLGSVGDCVLDIGFSLGLVFGFMGFHLLGDFSLMGLSGLDVSLMFGFDFGMFGLGLLDGSGSGFVLKTFGLLFGGFVGHLFEAQTEELFVELLLGLVSFFFVLFGKDGGLGFLAFSGGFLKVQFVELFIKGFFFCVKFFFYLFIGFRSLFGFFFLLVVLFLESVSSRRSASFNLFESEVIFFIITVSHQGVELLVEVVGFLVHSFGIDSSEFVQSGHNGLFGHLFLKVLQGKDFLVKFLLSFIMFFNSLLINMLMRNLFLGGILFFVLKFGEFLVEFPLLLVFFGKTEAGLSLGFAKIDCTLVS